MPWNSRPLLQSAPISENFLTLFCFGSIFLFFKEWTLNVDVDEVYDKTRMIPKTAKLQGIKEGRTIVLLTIGARALKSDS